MAPRDDLRLDASAILVSGLAGAPARQALTLALVDAVAGRPVALPEFDAAELEDLAAFAEEHRVRTITNRIAPGLGGDPLPALTMAVAIERRLLGSVQLLEDAGIEVLVLKGSATAHLDHRQPSDREVGDVDLLVRPERLTDAVRALEAAGHQAKVTHPFRDPSFFHSETLVHPDGTEIDLHIRLAQPARAPQSCWQAPESFVVGGRTLRAMPAHWRFLHALTHQMMNPPPSFRGLNGLLDIVALAPRVDLAAVRAAADEVRLRAVVEHGLVRTAALVGLDVPPVTMKYGPIERRLGDAFDSNRPTPGYLSFAGNLTVLAPTRWPRFLAELMWPSRAYRTELDVSLRSQFSHVVSEVLGR